MIRLTRPVTPGGGAPDDIALVQVLLARAAHRRRPFWRGAVDGRMDPQLRTAIELFQFEAGIMAPPLAERPGWIDPDGPTLERLKAAVPRGLLAMRALPGPASGVTPAAPVVFIARRHQPTLEREVARLVDPAGDRSRPDDAVLRAFRIALAAMLRRCHEGPGVQLVVLADLTPSGQTAARLGVKGLSIAGARGQFETLRAGRPDRVPEAIWTMIQRQTGALETISASRSGGFGWFQPPALRSDAA